MGDPKISIVASGRNDDYGGNFLARFFRFLESCQRFTLPAEIVFVEYNPVLTAPKLSQIIQEAKHQFAKVPICVVEVSQANHIAFLQHYNLQEHQARFFQEYPSKNIGFRHAKGEYVIMTNPDIFYTTKTIQKLESLVCSGTKHTITAGNPRGKRIDVQPIHCFPDTLTVDQLDAHLVGLPQSTRDRGWRKAQQSGAINISASALGDFILVNRAAILQANGIPEAPQFCHHFEQPFVNALARAGAPEQPTDGIDIFHFDHSRTTDYKEKPVSNGCPPAHINGDDWGLSYLDLLEIQI